MRITVLSENTSGREDLQAEYGLSLYIEACGKKILFDAGQTGVFAENAEKLGICLADVDMAILSHGHYDHGGGLTHFLQINKTAPVYLHRNAFSTCCNMEGTYIGLDRTLRQNERVILTSGSRQLAPGLELTDCNRRKRTVPTEPFGLYVRKGGALVPERFLHEQYLLIREKDKRVCISGCSHKGIDNIAGWFSPDVLVGGFHLMRIKDEQVLAQKAQALLQGNTVYYTGHCTGAAQYAVLKQHMGDRVHAITTGTVLEL